MAGWTSGCDAAPPRTLLRRRKADLPVSSLLRTAPSRARGRATLKYRQVKLILFTDFLHNAYRHMLHPARSLRCGVGEVCE